MLEKETHRININIPMDLYKQLKIECVNSHCNMTELFIYLGRSWLAKIKEKK